MKSSTILGQLQADFEKIFHASHWSEGDYVRRLEDVVEDYYNMHAVAVSSAGAGLMCMMAHEPANRIAVSANTFFATGGVPAQIGKTVVLADCDHAEFDMCRSSMLRCQADAVIYTHVGGIAENYEHTAEYCDQYGIRLYEDAAHIFGVPYAPKGLAAVFSLYPTKAIPAGEGGVIITRHESLAEAYRRFRNYGKYIDNGVVKYTGHGFNLRLDEWTAAVALRQFGDLDGILARRYEDWSRLAKLVDPLVEWDLCNYYKFVAPADCGFVQQAGKTYAASDQLLGILPGAHGKFELLPGETYEGCKYVADSHICLPVGEDTYGGWSDDKLSEWLSTTK